MNIRNTITTCPNNSVDKIKSFKPDIGIGYILSSLLICSVLELLKGLYIKLSFIKKKLHIKSPQGKSASSLKLVYLVKANYPGYPFIPFKSNDVTSGNLL